MAQCWEQTGGKVIDESGLATKVVKVIKGRVCIKVMEEAGANT